MGEWSVEKKINERKMSEMEEMKGRKSE